MQKQQFAPVKTQYKGYSFRSRLEAKWAVFFDTLGVRWEYEPDGYPLRGGEVYLPDFLIRNTSIGSLWVEVKGIMTEKDARKIRDFAFSSDDLEFEGPDRAKIFVVGNMPYGDDFDELLDDVSETENSDPFGLTFNLRTVRRSFRPGMPVLLNSGQLGIWCVDWDILNGCKDGVDVERTLNAYKAARQARFEHGETPPTPFKMKTVVRDECGRMRIV